MHMMESGFEHRGTLSRHDELWVDLGMGPNRSAKNNSLDMGVEPTKIWENPQIIHLFIGLSITYFHHPFWGFSPYFWKHPICFKNDRCVFSHVFVLAMCEEMTL